jgi:1,2-diacylglycerol 3-alpha-glucosyltransferase
LCRHLGGWRYGMASAYEAEQTSFALHLWLRIRDRFDILHVQDPVVARILDRLNRAGLSRPRVILANGTGEKITSLTGLSRVQELLPPALQKWDELAGRKPRLFLAPNFIDMRGFTPGDREEARRRMGLPADAFIVLCSAAIRRFHKRMDYLLHEFAAFSETFDRPALLVIAGGRESDTDELIALGRDLLGERVRFIVAAPRGDMPVLYKAADVFTIASLYETGSIAVIEALATGLPTICHDEANFHALGGPSNRYVDMTLDGALADALRDLASSPRRGELGSASRAYAEATFSETAVIDRILDIYRQVMAEPGR